MGRRCMNEEHLPVQIVEKGEKVEAQFAPGLFLAIIQNVCIHHTHWIIHNLRPICRTVEKPEGEKAKGNYYRGPILKFQLSRCEEQFVPPEVIEQQGDVKAQSYPLPCAHEHQTEQPVDGILWYHQLEDRVKDRFKYSSCL